MAKKYVEANPTAYTEALAALIPKAEAAANKHCKELVFKNNEERSAEWNRVYHGHMNASAAACGLRNKSLTLPYPNLPPLRRGNSARK